MGRRWIWGTTIMCLHYDSCMASPPAPTARRTPPPTAGAMMRDRRLATEEGASTVSPSDLRGHCHLAYSGTPSLEGHTGQQ